MRVRAFDINNGPAGVLVARPADHFTTVPEKGESEMRQHLSGDAAPGQSGNKTCSACSQCRPLAEFNRAKGDRLKARCRECDRAYMKRYYAANKGAWDASRAKHRDRRNARRRDEYRENEQLRQKCIAQARDYRMRNPGRKRASNLFSMYGITVEQYAAMLAAQGGGCAICGRADNGGQRAKWLHVDHCHRTGRVRGVLCAKCNKAIGLFADDPTLLVRGASYLRKGEDQ